MAKDNLPTDKRTQTRGMTGAAGEYYVAAELSRRGWLATVTIKNAPGTDVLAQKVDTALTVAIQTKTASPGSLFRLTEKDERPARTDHEWYVLVRLKGEQERPDFFVVPRDFGAAFIHVGHGKWLSEPGKKGQQHKDNPQRNIDGAWITDFLERWDLLEPRRAPLRPRTTSGYSRRQRCRGSDSHLPIRG